MPNLETQEQVDKAINALKEYQIAVKAAAKASANAHDKLGALKNITGITNNAGPTIEEEVLRMLGYIHVHGLPEVR